MIGGDIWGLSTAGRESDRYRRLERAAREAAFDDGALSPAVTVQRDRFWLGLAIGFGSTVFGYLLHRVFA